MLPIGSTVGAFVTGYLMDRFGPHTVLAGSYSLAAAFIVLLGLSTATPRLLVLAVFGAGLGTGGSQIGINALSASYYPTSSRATGVSWANAVGRSGSLVGSMIGGSAQRRLEFGNGVRRSRHPCFWWPLSPSSQRDGCGRLLQRSLSRRME